MAEAEGVHQPDAVDHGQGIVAEATPVEVRGFGTGRVAVATSVERPAVEV
jgi:hypothetical protein